MRLPKLYRVIVRLDTGRKILGPVVTENDREKFVELINRYNELTNFKLEDGWVRIVMPQQMVERSYVELRRVGYIRVYLREILRRLIG